MRNTYVLNSNVSSSPFNKFPLFTKDLITFTISFISLFVRVIHKPVINEIPFLIFLTINLSPASTKAFFAIELTNNISPIVGSNASGEIN